MKANARNLEKIFDPIIVYQVPLFQRPYVWTEEDNWAPLWEDILSLLDLQMEGRLKHSHFMGAVVFEQVKNSTGSVEIRQVIDGQQRLTTLQLFLLAAKSICVKKGYGKYEDCFRDLVENKASRIDSNAEIYKVWPTNSDREDFVGTHSCESKEKLLEVFNSSVGSVTGNKIPDAFLYFYEKIDEWLHQYDSENGSAEPVVSDHLDALWQVVKSHLQLVVIDLGDDDESQVIFETLNAKGTQLLPADLIKNFLFHRANIEKENIEDLYYKNWAEFDNDFWREEIKQGRLKRPRIDLFIQHFLTLKKLDDVRVSHLFADYKTYVLNSSSALEGKENEAATAGEHIKMLKDYGAVFKYFYVEQKNRALKDFLSRLSAVDTATVYPFLLEACFVLLDKNDDELLKILEHIESFLIRRMVCGLTTKNYNRLFIDLLKFATIDGTICSIKVGEFLLKGEGDSRRFPDDKEFENAWHSLPIYQKLAQYKIREIFSVIETKLDDPKSESIKLPDDLTIEHLLPQNWEKNWLPPFDENASLENKLEAEENRNIKLHTFGNLTLITGSLNPSISNSSWELKQPEIIKFSKLNLNRYFHDSDIWGEAEIGKRSKSLFEIASKKWSYPNLVAKQN